MRIGIIVHSQTGNTLSVGEKLGKALEKKGHKVTVERVTAQEQSPGSQKPVTLMTIPKVEELDAVIFGSPVWGFSLTPVMKAYLNQLPALSKIKTACFVTQHFPMAWMGGTRTLGQMREILAAKHGDMKGIGIVNWSRKDREQQIEKVAADLSALF